MVRSAPAIAATLASLALALWACGVAWAENAPREVAIEAEQVEIDRNSGRVTFEGNVRLRHGDLQLECDRLWAAVDSEAGRITSIEARGSVRIRAAGMTATAGSARYEPGQARLVLGGQPRVVAPSGELQGRAIVINLREARVSVQGARGVFRIR